MEFPGHDDDLLHCRRLHLPDGRSQQRISAIPCPIFLRPERPSSLLEAAGALTDRRNSRTDDAGKPKPLWRNRFVFVGDN